MLTAVAILCVLMLIAWALVMLYAAARWVMRLADEAEDAADNESLALHHADVTTDALPERAPVGTVRDQAGQVVPAAAPRIGYDHFIADLPNPEWSWKPGQQRE